MVGFIQRYNLSASRGAGSSILSANIVAYLCIAVLNQIRPLRPISRKKSLRLEGENLFTFWPIFRHMGRVLEGALIVVTVIQVATANAAKGFWRSAGGIAGWWE